MSDRRSATAGRLWAFRARAELDAAARFQRLEHELARVGGSAALVDLAGEAAIDERRHHVLCAELAQRFGARDVEGVEQPAAPLRTGLHDPREQLLYEMIAMSCVTESLSAALLLQMRREAEDAAVKRVVQEVLRDEVRHARLGWAHLAGESSRRSVAFVGPCLPAILAATVDEEIFAEGTGPGDDLGALGGLSRATRYAIFTSTMREVVFPGLQRFGVPVTAADAWLRSRERATA
jgi:hypothetical protein